MAKLISHLSWNLPSNCGTFSEWFGPQFGGLAEGQGQILFLFFCDSSHSVKLKHDPCSFRAKEKKNTPLNFP